MSKHQPPVDDLIAATPALQSWWAIHRSDQDDFGVQCGLLASELLTHPQGTLLAELAALAPAIEKLLEEHDESDAVSLGFVETLLHGAQGLGAKLEPIRDSLGPSAREVWDDLNSWERQHDLRPVTLDYRGLGYVLEEPALVQLWLISAGNWADSGAVIGRLTVGSRIAELRVSTRCYIDRFAAVPGDLLEQGALLLYLAPEDPGIAKEARLCTLQDVPPIPEAAA